MKNNKMTLAGLSLMEKLTYSGLSVRLARMALILTSGAIEEKVHVLDPIR